MPSEDQGYILGSLTLPDAASLQRTREAGAAVQQILLGHPAVEHVFVVAGLDVIAGANKTNAATIFIPLKPWDERKATCGGSGEARHGRGREAAAGHAAGVQSRGHPRPGQRRRIRGLPAGPRRRRSAEALPEPAAVPRRAAQAAGAHRHRVVLSPDFAAALRRRRPREGRRARRAAEGRVRHAAEHDGRALRQRLQQVRPHLSRAAPGRGRLSREAGRSGQRLRPLLGRRHDSGEGADQREERDRSRADRPLQRLPRGQGARQQRAGRELRAGDRRGRGRREIASARLYDRLDRAGLPGKAHRDGVDPRVHFRDRHGVPDPVGELRAVVAAGGGAARGAVRRCSAR